MGAIKRRIRFMRCIGGPRDRSSFPSNHGCGRRGYGFASFLTESQVMVGRALSIAGGVCRLGRCVLEYDCLCSCC